MTEMRKHIVLLALLSFLAVLGAAGPAFTADNGSVAATVSVAQPPAPCITLSTGAVDFGTLPFSDPAAASTPISVASPGVHVTSCSTADENISLAASDATTASGGTWDGASSAFSNTCSLGPNVYEPYYGSPNGGGLLYNTPTQVGPVLGAAQGEDLTLKMRMPCRGSVGAGGTASITFTTLAALA
jgi:hypothetical protein